MGIYFFSSLSLTNTLSLAISQDGRGCCVYVHPLSHVPRFFSSLSNLEERNSDGAHFLSYSFVSTIQQKNVVRCLPIVFLLIEFSGFFAFCYVNTYTTRSPRFLFYSFGLLRCLRGVEKNIKKTTIARACA
jgi:hypothetical protein